jgi:hypothetical protein
MLLRKDFTDYERSQDHLPDNALYLDRLGGAIETCGVGTSEADQERI